MKKIILAATAFVLAFSFNSNAQTSALKKATSIKTSWYESPWTVEGNIGTRALGVVSDGVENGLGLALNGGFGYSFNSVFGVKGRMDYYNHTLTPGYLGAEESRANSVALSLLLTMDLVPLIKSGRKSSWNFNIYAGSGLTTSWSPELKDFVSSIGGEFNDPFIKGNDDMGHIVVGVNPRYFVTSRFALSLDVSYFTLLNQDFTYDYQTRLTDGETGNALTIGLGFVWRPYGSSRR